MPVLSHNQQRQSNEGNKRQEEEKKVDGYLYSHFRYATWNWVRVRVFNKPN